MLEKSDTAVLQFSGGKDSLACLFLLRDYWQSLIVLWVNTGAAFPETLEQMAMVRELVPNFLEIKSDQPAQIAKFGNPTDLVSWWDTPLGRSLDSSRITRAQTPTSCCKENIWVPMHEATMRLKPTVVIRGQRNAEQRKGPVRDGMVYEGVRYWFPIEDWSDNDVYAYLREVGVPLPANYDYMNTSLDCWSCTAYLDENAGKFTYMKERHPGLYARAQVSLDCLARAARIELDRLVNCASL